MECYKDRCFCGSPDCKNKCGRKITPAELDDAERRNVPIAYGYFCGEPKGDALDVGVLE